MSDDRFWSFLCSVYCPYYTFILKKHTQQSLSEASRFISNSSVVGIKVLLTNSDRNLINLPALWQRCKSSRLKLYCKIINVLFPEWLACMCHIRKFLRNIRYLRMQTHKLVYSNNKLIIRFKCKSHIFMIYSVYWFAYLTELIIEQLTLAKYGMLWQKIYLPVLVICCPDFWYLKRKEVDILHRYSA